MEKKEENKKKDQIREKTFKGMYSPYKAKYILRFLVIENIEDLFEEFIMHQCLEFVYIPYKEHYRFF